ncbi:MAG: HDOD domain-containing protein [Leptospiraceae bacterium]|nr:HDOD domain-containing protein [Leptospiraceae bacterium]
MKEIALGVNRKNLKPYNTMILCSSGSERRLLEQYLRIAGFKITGAEEKLISYFEEKVVDIPVKEKSESEVEEDEFSEEEMNLNEILLGFDKIDILFIEYKPYSNTLVLIQRIHQMYSKMIVFLIIDSIKKELIENLLQTKANAYLVKPISKNVIYDKLKIILKRNDLTQKVVIGYKPKGFNLQEMHIPPLPTVLNKVILFDTEKMGGSEELENIIAPDKSLSADLMRVANSAYYGRSGGIHTLRDAITLMGLKTINNIVLVKFRQKYTAKLRNPLYRKYLEEFPILIGLIALDLCAPLNLKILSKEIFIHSILMKIGMTMLALNEPERYSHVLEQYGMGSRTLVAIEREEFNTDYVHIGLNVFKAWHFPNSMATLVANQEFFVEDIHKVGDLDRLLRVSELFSLLLLGRKLMKEEMELVREILKFYHVQENIITLFNQDYYNHIKSHPFFELL